MIWEAQDEQPRLCNCAVRLSHLPLTGHLTALLLPPLPQPSTQSMAYGVPAVFFGGGLLVALRLWHFFRVALKFQVRPFRAIHLCHALHHGFMS